MKVSPKSGFASLIPCNAIDVITVKAASSSFTLLGTKIHKFSLTATISACGPLEATLSPTLYFLQNFQLE